MATTETTTQTQPRARMRWLQARGARGRATLHHIRVTGQLGRPEDLERVRNTGARV